MGSGPPGSREAANGGSPGNQGVKAASAAGATNGGSALPSAQLGMKRCFFVYQVLVGYNVKVQVVGGQIFEGIFSSIDSKGIHLRMASLTHDSTGKLRATKPEPIKVIPTAEWLSIDATDVRMGSADVGPLRAGDDAGGFGTDAAISRGRGGTEGRELQRWTPDAAEEAAFMHLEDNMGREHLGWDQFALNESRFGVKTDYNEEFYTTTLDPTKSKISVAEAARIAREIERGDKSGVTNIHILEERGIEIDDGDMDEEARYGAVIRENPAPQAAGHPAGAWGRGPPTASVPISIDSRKEANKVRAHMTSGKSTSPYGTPKTQLTSPLVSDAQKLEALNLDPGVAHVDAATRREFEVFKAEQAKKGAPPPTLSDFKQFSQQVGTKLQKTSSNAASETTATSSSVGGGEAGETPSSEKKATTSTLNPNAKSFSFNINARSFTPTFTPGAGAQAKPAAAPAPVPGPGSAPVAVPTPSGNRTPGSEGRPGPMRSQDGDGGHGYAHNNARRYDDYPRDDRRDMRAGGGMRPPPPPPEGSMPPPPPPGRSPPGGGPGHMAMAGMGVPSMMVPVMMQSGPHGMMYRPVQGAPQMFMPTGQPYMMRPPMIMTPTGVPLQMVPAGMGYPGPGAGYPPGAGPGVHRGDGDGGDR